MTRHCRTSRTDGTVSEMEMSFIWSCVTAHELNLQTYSISDMKCRLDRNPGMISM